MYVLDKQGILPNYTYNHNPYRKMNKPEKELKKIKKKRKK